MDNTWATPVCASVKRNALFEVKLTVLYEHSITTIVINKIL